MSAVMGADLEAALAALAAGGMVVVVDDADREDEGDLVLAAETATTEQLAFLVRHGTGLVCVPMEGARLDELALPAMVDANTDRHRTAFTVSVDHVATGTGVSAADRAATVRALTDAATRSSDLRRPGHVFPLRYREGGVLRRAGHTEAAVDLLRLAGRAAAAVICELVEDDGSMMRPPSLRRFAARHGLPVVAIADLVRYRRSTESVVVESGSAALPTTYGEFRAIAFRSPLDDQEHLALTMGDVAAHGRGGRSVLVRVHSECLTGDILASLKCDCGHQLDQAMRMIADEGRGVVIYLRGQEGRGIGLGHKLRAYALQDKGRDTVDANLELGVPVDDRDYGAGAAILAALGVRSIRLITHNPLKYNGLAAYDLDIVERVTPPSAVTPENLRYLRTKRDRLGHDLLPDALPGA
jgi:3,4-dihydroxy 2-butanone 4-phosphate synthase / GTP cyclohydrolase II